MRKALGFFWQNIARLALHPKALRWAQLAGASKRSRFPNTATGLGRARPPTFGRDEDATGPTKQADCSGIASTLVEALEGFYSNVPRSGGKAYKG